MVIAELPQSSNPLAPFEFQTEMLAFIVQVLL